MLGLGEMVLTSVNAARLFPVPRVRGKRGMRSVCFNAVTAPDPIKPGWLWAPLKACTSDSKGIMWRLNPKETRPVKRKKSRWGFRSRKACVWRAAIPTPMVHDPLQAVQRWAEVRPRLEGSGVHLASWGRGGLRSEASSGSLIEKQACSCSCVSSLMATLQGVRDLETRSRRGWAPGLRGPAQTWGSLGAQRRAPMESESPNCLLRSEADGPERRRWNSVGSFPRTVRICRERHADGASELPQKPLSQTSPQAAGWPQACAST